MAIEPGVDAVVSHSYLLNGGPVTWLTFYRCPSLSPRCIVGADISATIKATCCRCRPVPDFLGIGGICCVIGSAESLIGGV